MPNLHHHRLTSRVVLFDRSGAVLLFLTRAPDTSGASRWLTPGGGVDPGENHETAGYRELFEETGLTGVPLGAPVWAHDFDVAWDDADHDTGHAEFYTAIVDRFEPSQSNWTEDEKVDVLQSRWWTLAELETTDEPFEPAELVELVRANLPVSDRSTGEQRMSDDTAALIARIENQERRLRFPSFTNDDALRLGLLLVRLATERGLGVAIDITRGEQQLVHIALDGSTADNDDWIARKTRVVRRFAASSFLVGLRQSVQGKDFNETYDLPLSLYAAHGGSFPVVVTGVGLIGTVTVSGLPQEVDHALVVEAIGMFLESSSL